MKIIVITGGCGLLGWEFANALARENNKICILDNSSKKLNSERKIIINQTFFFIIVTSQKRKM